MKTQTFRRSFVTCGLCAMLVVASAAYAQQDLLVSAFDKAVPETRRDLLTIERSAVELAKRVAPCTVALNLDYAMGSGVVISEDGLILTAAHVVSRPGREVTVRFPDGRRAKGVSLGMHTSADGALVKITDEGKWPFLELVEEGQGPKVGDWCLAAGHPGGFDEDRSPPIRLGRVIEVRPTVLRTDCPITGGDSGGPLLDMQGRVIGIHSRITSSLTENYHVPGLVYREAWDALLNSEIYPDPVPSQMLALLDQNQDGKLTRSELSSEFQRGVFDRLVEEFNLDTSQEIHAKEVAEKTFDWEVATHVPIDEVEDLRSSDDLALSSRDFVRGSSIERVFELTLNETQPSESSGHVDREQALVALSSQSAFDQVTVRVYADGRRVALGTIVDADGLILTKASRLNHEAIQCVMPDGRRLDADVVANDDGYDFALLRVAASGLRTPSWAESPLAPGAWVAVPDTAGRLQSLGVIGVAPREIKPTQPYLGVQLDPRIIGEAVIAGVVPGSGAAQSGVQVGDVLISVAGERVANVKEVREILRGYRAGDIVPVLAKRDGEDVKLDILLLAESDVLFSTARMGRHMTGRLNRRRDGFQSAFQIDAPVKPELCGGPVVDLNGHVIGVTLARADRVASYAIGFKDLQPVLDRLIGEAEIVKTNTTEIQ